MPYPWAITPNLVVITYYVIKLQELYDHLHEQLHQSLHHNVCCPQNGRLPQFCPGISTRNVF